MTFTFKQTENVHVYTTHIKFAKSLIFKPKAGENNIALGSNAIDQTNSNYTRVHS